MAIPVFSLWRTLLCPGDFTYVWANQAVIPATAQLKGPATRRVKVDQLSRRASPSHYDYQGAITVPANAPLGRYSIRCGPFVAGFLEVTDDRAKVAKTSTIKFDESFDLDTAKNWDCRVAPNTLFVRCSWHGIANPGYEWPCKIMGDGCAFIDCNWYDTLRGPLIETNANRVNGCLIQAPFMDGLYHGHNLEGIAVEGPKGMRSITILGGVYRGCGPGIQLVGPIDGICIRGAFFPEGNGISLYGVDSNGAGAPQTVEEIRDCEMGVGGFWFGNGVTGPGIDHLWDRDRNNHVADPRSSRWNNSEGPAGAAWARPMLKLPV